VVVSYDHNEFITQLKNPFDIAWIIPNNGSCGDDAKFTEAVLDFFKSGRGLMIWADNEPHFYQANLVLPQLVGCKLVGNDHCANLLKFGEPNVTGNFDKNHVIFSGINNLYEGITISYPDNNTNKLKVLATSSYSHPCLLCCERGQSNIKEGGRLIVDTGFTKLGKNYWASAGQARYVVNASVWLTDVEGRFEQEITCPTNL